MATFSVWRGRGGRSVGTRSDIALRFDAAQAVVISSAEELAAMSPGFLHSVSKQFNVDLLAARLCPVLLMDQSVAISARRQHVGSDQADELARQIIKSGYAPANPARYVLAAPLLLAIARQQITAQSLSSQPGVRLTQSKTALADAFQDLVEWACAMVRATCT